MARHSISHPPKHVIWIRSIIFWIGMATATCIHATLSLFTAPFPLHWRYRFITLWSHFIIFWLRVTCHINYEIVGKEHLPKHRPLVVASKHQSAWETVAFQVLFPPQSWVLKRELLWLPFFGWALALMRPIAINRARKTSAIDQLIQQGLQKLAQGFWVIVFPEGTRMPVGQQKAFAKGGIKLAHEAKVPLVPIAHNAGLFWPKNGFLKYPGMITVVIGPIIESDQYSVNELTNRVKIWIDQTTQQLEQNPSGKDAGTPSINT